MVCLIRLKISGLIDLDQVGDLLALTNSLVQVHNLDGGSQMTPNQSRRHHSPKGNRWCVVDELLALVLQMIVSQTLNSLSHRIGFGGKKV